MTAPCRWCGARDGEPHDGATHDAYAASDPPGVGYNAADPGAIVTAYVKCPECGKGFLAMADEEVTGCAQHGV